jgi:hypothetical protein
MKIIRTIIKIMEYDVKISHVMFKIFSVVRIIVGSHAVERLSWWMLLRPRLCCNNVFWILFLGAVTMW